MSVFTRKFFDVPLWGWLLLGAGGTFGVLAYFDLSLNAEPKSMAPTLPSTKRNFIARMLAAINSVDASIPDVGKALIIAHAAYEVNWGAQRTFAKSLNAFNITAGSAWLQSGKPTVPGPDTEYDEAGNVRAIAQDWRAYASLADSVADYLQFITKYSGAKGMLYAGQVVDYAAALRAGGYFTLPLTKYTNNLLATFATVRTTVPLLTA